SAVYGPELVAGLPEIAQRYFNHAIAPGTPLSTTVDLRMEGTCLLGTAAQPQPYAMQVRQILAPPAEFVWIADMQSGPVAISGADMLHDGAASMRFWMFGVLPLVSEGPGEDINRSAAIRPALEGVWAPASL